MKKYALLLLLASACVPMKKYNALKVGFDEKEVELTEAKATIFTLNKQLEEAQEEKNALTKDLRKLTSSAKANKNQEEEIVKLERKIKYLEEQIAFLKKKSEKTSTTKTTKKQKTAY